MLALDVQYISKPFPPAQPAAAACSMWRANNREGVPAGCTLADGPLSY